jgi:selenium metabolism protein YedF
MGKVIFVKSQRMGRGNKELGILLMRNFLYAIARAEVKPSVVYLVNDGVRLACAGSESIDDLGILVESGVPVYSCGTCLDFLELKDSLRIGGVGRMDDLVAAMLSKNQVVTVS